MPHPDPDEFRKIYGDKLADQVESLKNKNAINSVERERKQRELDEEAKRLLKEAAEDEARRFPDR